MLEAKENCLYYCGYKGSINWSEEDWCYYGTVQDIEELISYEGNTLKELEEDFNILVEDYIETKLSIATNS
jgi:predicted RNase H-like HicB family nuclease